jgi:hypothetical protein
MTVHYRPLIAGIVFGLLIIALASWRAGTFHFQYWS